MLPEPVKSRRTTPGTTPEEIVEDAEATFVDLCGAKGYRLQRVSGFPNLKRIAPDVVHALVVQMAKQIHEAGASGDTQWGRDLLARVNANGGYVYKT